MIYDIHGTPLDAETTKGRFRSLIDYKYGREPITGAFYTVLNIPQTNLVGEKQYPFVLWPNYPNGGIESALDLNKRENYLVAINAGRFSSPFGPGVSVTGAPQGTVIQNSQVLRQGTESESWAANYTLTIDSDGKMGYAAVTDDAATLVTNGVVSAVSGFIPLLSNYVNIDEIIPDLRWMGEDGEVDSQRQVIGQYYNGDYAILTTEGRGYQGGGFFTTKQVQTMCRSLGFRDAFLLDGGGSAETVVGDRQLNVIYDDTYGRKVPTYIVFNGTTTFPDT